MSVIEKNLEFRSKYSQLLSNKNFLRIWFAQIISTTAQNMMQFTLLTLIFGLSKEVVQRESGSSFATSMLLVVLALPAIFFGSYGGVLADRRERRALLTITNFTRAGVALLYLIIAQERSFAGLAFFYLNAFVFSSVNQFFIPAETASIPELVHPNELLKANALFTQTLYLTFILGVSIAGPIQSTLGNLAPFPVAAAMFAICGILTLGLPRMRNKAVVETHTTHFISELFSEAKNSLKLIKSRASLYIPIIELTLAQVVIGVMVILAPAFVDRILGLDISKAGLLLITPAGVGMILSATLIGLSDSKKRKGMVQIGFFLLGMTLMLLANVKPISEALRLDRPELLLVAVSFFIGLWIALIIVPAQTSLTESTEPEIRGRVFGFLNMNINLTATLPLVGAGFLADIFPIRWVIFYFGLFLALFLLLEMVLVKKSKEYKD